MISQSRQKDYKWIEGLNKLNFFTEAQLLGYIFHHYIINTLKFFQANLRVSQERDICTIILVKKGDEGDQHSLYKQITFRITIIQIQSNLKIHIIHSLQGWKQEVHHNYQPIDQFWFNIKSYFPKKISSSYKMCELVNQKNGKKFSSLLNIIDLRAIQPIRKKIQALMKQDKDENISNVKEIQRKQGLLTALSINFSRIYKYLKPKEYKNLLIFHRQIYQILCNQKNFKILFEQKWGKTGFSLEQKNWVKMYQNKLLQSENKKIK